MFLLALNGLSGISGIHELVALNYIIGAIGIEPQLLTSDSAHQADSFSPYRVTSEAQSVDI